MRIIEITNDNQKKKLDELNTHIEKGGKSVIALTAPWCGHCQALKPELKKCNSLVKGNGIFAHVSDKYHPALNADTNIDGFPTIRFLIGGKKVKDFNGARDASSIANFVNTSLGEALIGGRRKTRGKRKRRRRKSRRRKVRKTQKRRRRKSRRRRKTRIKKGGGSCEDTYKICTKAAGKIYEYGQIRNPPKGATPEMISRVTKDQTRHCSKVLKYCRERRSARAKELWEKRRKKMKPGEDEIATRLRQEVVKKKMRGESREVIDKAIADFKRFLAKIDKRNL